MNISKTKAARQAAVALLALHMAGINAKDSPEAKPEAATPVIEADAELINGEPARVVIGLALLDIVVWALAAWTWGVWMT